MTCFNVTELERTLALELSLPIYGCDPDLLSWGSKSGSRQIFREAGIAMPEGLETSMGPKLLLMLWSSSGLADPTSAGGREAQRGVLG